MTILVACGLKREAAILRGDGIVPIAGGGDAEALGSALEDAITRQPFVAILSSGIAGALDPALRVGATVIDGDAALLAWLRRTLPKAHSGRVVGSDTMLVTGTGKAALHASTGAFAIDMESHVAARVAARHGLPFAAIRIISDSAIEDLPPAVRVGMKPDGGMALAPVLASLAKNPAQLPALIRTGLNAGRAFRALARVHHMLGRAGIGRLDLREFTLDMR